MPAKHSMVGQWGHRPLSPFRPPFTQPTHFFPFFFVYFYFNHWFTPSNISSCLSSMSIHIIHNNYNIYICLFFNYYIIIYLLLLWYQCQNDDIIDLNTFPGEGGHRRKGHLKKDGLHPAHDRQPQHLHRFPQLRCVSALSLSHFDGRCRWSMFAHLFVCYFVCADSTDALVQGFGDLASCLSFYLVNF